MRKYNKNIVGFTIVLIIVILSVIALIAFKSVILLLAEAIGLSVIVVASFIGFVKLLDNLF